VTVHLSLTKQTEEMRKAMIEASERQRSGAIEVKVQNPVQVQRGAVGDPVYLAAPPGQPWPFRIEVAGDQRGTTPIKVEASSNPAKPVPLKVEVSGQQTK
jgi:hypothetical protein